MQLMGWAVEAVGTWARVNLEEIEEGSGQVGPYPCIRRTSDAAPDHITHRYTTSSIQSQASSSSLSSVHALQEELKDLSYTLCQIRPVRTRGFLFL